MTGITLTDSPVQLTILSVSSQNPVLVPANVDLDGLALESTVNWTLTNQGQIECLPGVLGSFYGIPLFITSGSINNSGKIIGSYDFFAMQATGSVKVTNSGEIAGRAGGFDGLSGTDTIINSGYISSVNFTGTLAQTVINSGSIASLTLVNGNDLVERDVGGTFGAISAVGTSNRLALGGVGGQLTGLATKYAAFDTVSILAGASWTLPAGNTISATEAEGLTIAGTLINGGSFASEVLLSYGGNLTNLAGARIDDGGLAGVASPYGQSTIINAGTIFGSLTGVNLSGSGAVTNSAGGLIAGGLGAVGVFTNAINPTITNFGTINSGFGVLMLGAAATLVNGGLIIGSGGTAVNDNQAGVLVLDPGASFSGKVQFGGGSSLLLAGTGATGTYAGIDGTSFGGFSNATVVAGAQWALTGTNSVPAGITLFGGLTNQGVLGNGVILATGGSFTNAATGTLNGSTDAVLADAAGTLVNAGRINGAAGFSGVRLVAGGTLNNTASGYILGGAYGVRIATVGASITNTGTIYGVIGLGATTGSVTVTNAGTIRSHGSTVATFTGSNNRLILDAGEVMAGAAGGGGTNDVLELTTGSAATGTLTGLGTSFTGFSAIQVDSGATWSMTGSGTIAGDTLSNAGSLSGAFTVGSGGRVLNTGSLGGAITVGSGGSAINTGSLSGPVTVGAGGYLTNAAGGIISGAGDALFGSGSGTILNAGQIVAGPRRSGVHLSGGGTLTNQAGGIIRGAYYGVNIDTTAPTIVNAGTIYGTTGILAVVGGVTVTNAGTITPHNGAGVLLSGANNRLVLDAGEVINGNLVGGSAANDVLELAQGTAATGTLVGLGGTSVTGFGSVTIDAGATWSISGTPSFGSGLPLSNAGTLTSPVTLAAGGQFTNTAGARQVGGVVEAGDATVVNSGLITASTDAIDMLSVGTVTNTGTISGAVGVRASVSGVTLTASGTILGTAGAAVSLTGANNRLIVDAGAVLASAIGGNATNDVLELATGVSAAGTLAGFATGFSGFNAVTIDAGARWSLGNAATFNAGYNLSNAGTLTSTVTLAAGRLTNAAAATIAGATYGVVGTGSATITNAGTISGSARGVNLTGANNRLILDAGEVLASATGGSGAGDVLELATGPAAIGTITGIGTSFTGFSVIGVDAGATWSLAGNNTLASSVSLIVYGTLNGTMNLLSGSSATVAATGTVNGSADGFWSHGVATIDNLGVINAAGSRSGVLMTGGGSLFNQTGGFIHGGNYGVRIYAAGATVTNAGSIDGFTGIYASVAGVTVINSGAISSRGGAIVLLSGTNNRVVLDAGEAMAGAIGGSTSSDVLELATGAAATGTLSGLGTSFTGFDTVTADASADWSLTGGNTIEAGVRLLDAGILAGAISLVSGASVTIAATGTINGTGDGLDVTGAEVVDNAGRINAAASHSGVRLTGAGTLRNEASGFIDGTYYGLRIDAAGATITNLGTIYGGTGVFADVAGVTVTNAGTILSGGGAIMELAGANNRLVLDAGAVQAGAIGGSGVSDVLELATGTVATGTLAGLGSAVIGFNTLAVDAGANWYLAAAATLTSGMTLQDTGTVTGAITLAAGALATIASGGSIGGTVNGLFASGAATIDNAGRITAAPSHAGVTLTGGGSLTNEASGSILGSYYGVRLANTAAAIVNRGTISGFTGLQALVGGVTVTNAGTIQSGGGGIVLLSGAGNRLVLDAGAVEDARVNGTIQAGVAGGISGGYGGNDVLELAAGPSATGTLSGLGSIVTGFDSVTLDAGASWMLTGTNAIGGGMAFTVAGTIGNAGLADATFVLLAGSTLTNSATGTINGTTDGLVVNSAATRGNAGTITGMTGIDATVGGVTLTNTGTILSNGGSVVLLSGSNNRMILGGGAVQAGAFGGGGSNDVLELAVGRSAVGTLTGLGSTFSGFTGVTLDRGSNWSFSGTNTLAAGTSFAIAGNMFDTGTLTNAGVIDPAGLFVVAAGGVFTNAASGSVTGGFFGVVGGGAGTIVNAGSIAGAAQGMYLQAGGVLTNAASGSIHGGEYGIMILAGAATITNLGTIGGRYGVVGRSGGVTVVNAGAILRDPGFGAGPAVSLGAGNNRFVEDAGATVGNVFVTGSGNVLELAAGTAATGTIAGIGPSFTGFGSVTVDAGAAWTLTGANTLATGTTFTNAGSLTVSAATLTDAGALVNNGQILIDPSSVTVASLAGIGTVTIGAGSTLDVTGSISAGQTIVFADATGVLDLGAPSQASGVIGGFVSGDIIDLTGIAHAGSDKVNLLAGNTLQVITGSGTIDLDLAPSASFTGDYFHLSAAGGGSQVSEDQVACYLAGTLIRTDRGEVPVETLAIGDQAVTLSGEARPIKWIGRRSYASVFAKGNRDVVPIRIAAGALGDNLPVRDLFVSPLHALFLDGVLIPAEHLVNGASITRCDDIDPIRYFHVELDSHDVIFAEGAPAETFVDCDSRLMFHNAAEFAQLYPGDAAPAWAFCAPRVEAGETLIRIRRTIDSRAGLAGSDDNVPPGPLEGHLDGINGPLITGWAIDPTRPTQPVVLELLDGDGVIARVTANRYRADLEAAGIGDGRHAFAVRLAYGLSAAVAHELRVRRAADQAELHGSPLMIPPGAPDDRLIAADQAIVAAADSARDTADLDALLTTLLAQVDQVRQRRATRHPVARDSQALITWAEERHQRPKRALVIDDRLPRLDRDAGSNAVISHVAALQSLGWKVEFIAARELSATAPAAEPLEALGVTCHRLPHASSVEDVLRRHHGRFDLVYLHRLSNAEAYAGLSRAWQPKARLVYNVADLHHLRLAGQARLEGCLEAMADARWTRQREITAMRMVDAVITHSTAEAAYLAREVPGAAVHVVPWATPLRAQPQPVEARRGVAFIGSYDHAPNVDAVRWLAEAIMPLVWQRQPDLPCLIAGSGWPADPPFLRHRSVTVIGSLRQLGDLFDAVRLTVAPLRFGAGVKGKVLDSLAAGMPCVMTPVAAEGIALPSTLQGLVAGEPADLADAICRLHDDPEALRVTGEAGRALIRSTCSEIAVRQAMDAALRTQRGAAQGPVRHSA